MQAAHTRFCVVVQAFCSHVVPSVHAALQSEQEPAATGLYLPAVHASQLVRAALDSWPGAQVVQALCAVLMATYPASQFLHELPEKALYLPVGHARHVSCAALASYPLLQAVQKVSPVVAAMNPTVQVLQVDCVVKSWYFPVPHSVQLRLFTAGLYLPATHVWQLLPAALLYQPMAQLAHSVGGSFLASVPASQVVHTPRPPMAAILPAPHLVQVRRPVDAAMVPAPHWLQNSFPCKG